MKFVPCRYDRLDQQQPASSNIRWSPFRQEFVFIGPAFVWLAILSNYCSFPPRGWSVIGIPLRGRNATVGSGSMRVPGTSRKL